MLPMVERTAPPLAPGSWRVQINEITGEIEGYIAVWGSPQQRDSYGTFFDKAKPPDMALDFLPIPLMYEHGMTGTLKKEIVGKVVRFWFDDTGIAFSGFLNKATPAFPQILKEIRGKLLKTSSATSGHIADFDSEGRFSKWYLNELSLTKKPSESTMPIVKLIRSNNCPDGQCHINPSVYPLESLENQTAGVNTTGLTLLDIRSQVMSALLQLLQSGGEVTPESLIAAAQQDGLEPQTLLDVLQKMAQPQEGMSAALADGNVPGATPAPQIQPPAPQQPAPIVPGGSQVDPEILAQLQQLLQTRNVAGGRQLVTQQRNQQVAPPIPGNYLIQPVSNRSPQNPNQTRARAVDISMADKFQHIDGDAMALGYMFAEKAMRGRQQFGESPVSESYLRAMAYKTARQIQTQKGAATDYAVRAKFPFKTPDEVFQSDVTASIRANEIMDGAQNGQGAEWIYDLQGTSLWEAIRNETPVYGAMRSKGMDEAEIPQGFDGELIPLEGSDPTWYVANAAASIDSSGTPIGTFSTSKFGTGQRAISVAKLSVAMNFQRELEEGSIINIVQEAQRKIRVTAAEQIDYILLNGDTATGANTNINLIDSTPAAAPALPSYTLLNGMVKLALSAAATRRDAGLTFDETDFLATLKKLPAAKRQNRDKLLYILDSDTGIAASNIPTLKTRDVYSGATLEEGVLTSIWRIAVLETAFMYLANSAGKISATAGNNTLGRLLLVVPNQWAARWKRRISTDVTYFPFADTTQIVAHMRWGLAYRDTDAAAISYNIPVDLP